MIPLLLCCTRMEVGKNGMDTQYEYSPSLITPFLGQFGLTIKTDNYILRE